MAKIKISVDNPNIKIEPDDIFLCRVCNGSKHTKFLAKSQFGEGPAPCLMCKGRGYILSDAAEGLLLTLAKQGDREI